MTSLFAFIYIFSDMSAVSDEWCLPLQTRLLHLRGRIALQAIPLSPPAIPGRCPGLLTV